MFLDYCSLVESELRGEKVICDTLTLADLLIMCFSEDLEAADLPGGSAWSRSVYAEHVLEGSAPQPRTA